MNFIETMIAKASSDIKTIVLPEGNDRRIYEAAAIIQKNQSAKVVILADKEDFNRLSEGLDVSQAAVIDPWKFDRHEEFAEKFYNLRNAKGMTIEKARGMMTSPLYLGVMTVKEGLADGMVAGANNSTADTLRPALQIIKTAPGVKKVSGFFVMIVPDCEYGHNGAFVFADSGLVENPNPDELSEIAVTSAASFRALFNAEPVVGMLSYSTHGSASSSLTEKVVRATQLSRQKAPDVILDGEMQFDAAIVPEIGRSKAVGSPAAGHVNVLVFPDLNSGNIAYKVAQRLAKADAYGLITQGLAKPVNDLSRGCSAQDIAGVVAITAVQAQALKSR